MRGLGVRTIRLVPSSGSIGRTGHFTIAGELGKVEAVEVHYFGPRRNEVLNELLLGVGTSMDFRERAAGSANRRSGPLLARPIVFTRAIRVAFSIAQSFANCVVSSACLC